MLKRGGWEGRMRVLLSSAVADLAQADFQRNTIAVLDFELIGDKPETAEMGESIKHPKSGEFLDVSLQNPVQTGIQMPGPLSKIVCRRTFQIQSS
jgi:hypothetical protein